LTSPTLRQGFPVIGARNRGMSARQHPGEIPADEPSAF
jgi:hypothetical protein